MSTKEIESIIVVAGIVVVACFFWLSKTLNLDFLTILKISGYLVMIFLARWCIKSILSTELILWPLVMALVLCAFFPALDQWALQELPTFASRYAEFSDIFPTPWYATWYFKASIFCAPLIYGYMVHPKVFER